MGCERRILLLYLFPFLSQRRLQLSKAFLASQFVDSFEPSGGDEPGRGIFGDALVAPGVPGGGESLLHGFFSQIEVAQESDESGQDFPGLRPVESLEVRFPERFHLRSTLSSL